jgi:hypothetical protein
MDINPLFPIASAITVRLGWRFHVAEGAGQIIAHPPHVSALETTFQLRFADAGGAAPAIAVEIIDADGRPAINGPQPPIWLLPRDLSADTATLQIRRHLIEPYRAFVAERPSAAA